jgi:hypothetical protein
MTGLLGLLVLLLHSQVGGEKTAFGTPFRTNRGTRALASVHTYGKYFSRDPTTGAPSSKHNKYYLFRPAGVPSDFVDDDGGVANVTGFPLVMEFHGGGFIHGAATMRCSSGPPRSRRLSFATAAAPAPARRRAARAQSRPRPRSEPNVKGAKGKTVKNKAPTMKTAKNKAPTMKTVEKMSSCEELLDRGIAFASFDYRLDGTNYYFCPNDGGGADAAAPRTDCGKAAADAELIHVAADGALSLDAAGRTLTAYKVRIGRQELNTQCSYDAAAALEDVLARAGELGIDPHRLALTGSSAGGGEVGTCRKEDLVHSRERSEGVCERSEGACMCRRVREASHNRPPPARSTVSQAS